LSARQKYEVPNIEQNGGGGGSGREAGKGGPRKFTPDVGRMALLGQLMVERG